MLKKNYTKTGKSCRVTFKYPNEEQADSAVLAGDFNDWSLEKTPMKKLKDGSFSVTVSLKSGATYRFRYVLDGNIWVNDLEADSYEDNEFGEANSVITVGVPINEIFFSWFSGRQRHGRDPRASGVSGSGRPSLF